MIGGRVEDMEIDKILTDYVLTKDLAFYLKNHYCPVKVD